MDKKETNQLRDMLTEFYPRAAKERRSKNQEIAWAFALEPYRYDDVKAAALRHVRGNGFFPDVAELTVGLGGASEKTADTGHPCPYTASQLECIYARMEEMLEHGRKLEGGYA